MFFNIKFLKSSLTCLAAVSLTHCGSKDLNSETNSYTLRGSERQITLDGYFCFAKQWVEDNASDTVAGRLDFTCGKPAENDDKYMCSVDLVKWRMSQGTITKEIVVTRFNRFSPHVSFSLGANSIPFTHQDFKTYLKNNYAKLCEPMLSKYGSIPNLNSAIDALVRPAS